MAMIINRKTIFVISGPAGSGKGSLRQPLKERKDFCFSVSCTTRKIRPGDVEDVDYHFVTDDYFDKLVEEDGFIEWEHVHGNRYGTRKSDITEMLASDKYILLELDVKGALNIKKLFSNTVTIFILPPSLEICLQRLKARNSDSEESIEKRRQRYDMEISKAKLYDYQIVNDDLEKAQLKLQQIIDKHTKQPLGG